MNNTILCYVINCFSFGSRRSPDRRTDNKSYFKVLFFFFFTIFFIHILALSGLLLFLLVVVCWNLLVTLFLELCARLCGKECDVLARTAA
jgi:hypothetical protein